jgi:hypothetical protein
MMWIRKSKKEKRPDFFERFNPFFVLIVSPIAGLLGYPGSVVDYLLFSGLIFGIFYIIQILWGYRALDKVWGFLVSSHSTPSDKTYICVACHHFQLFSDSGCEKCSGTLDDPFNWKWVEDEKEQTENNAN